MPISCFEKIIEETCHKKYISGVVVCMASSDTRFEWSGAAGNLRVDDQYFIASTTKLYVTAIIFNFRQQGLIRLDDPLALYFSPWEIKGIHHYKGHDFSTEITIRQLLSHTSGLGDYFQGKAKHVAGSLEKSVVAGEDQSWNFEDVIRMTREIAPEFKPGQSGKAFYSDTNFQLLGKVIENVSGKSLSSVMKELIFQPLGLRCTYLYQDESDKRPVSLNYKDEHLWIPKAMSSFGADGGIVSTTNESMRYLQAFFKGELFPVEYLDEMSDWNRIFFPLEYGLGVSRFKLPRIFSPFKPFPELIGHSGLSGAFAFFCPERSLYMTGTVNQVARPGTSFKLMLELIEAYDKSGLSRTRLNKQEKRIPESPAEIHVDY